MAPPVEMRSDIDFACPGPLHGQLIALLVYADQPPSQTEGQETGKAARTLTNNAWPLIERLPGFMSPVVLSCATRFSATSCRVQCNVTTDDSRLDDSCGALAAVLGLKILAGFVVLEMLLAKLARGQGLGAAVQYRLSEALQASSAPEDVLYGTIGSNNPPMLKTAARVGRVDVGGWIWLNLV